MKKQENNDLNIPKLDINNNVLSKKLILISLIGFDEILGKRGALYYRLFSRLTDKCINEYKAVRELLIKEIEGDDKLMYFFEIIDRLENCVNALNRVAHTFETAKEDNKNNDLFDFVSNTTKDNLNKYNGIIKKIRHRVEHIDEDIAEIGNHKLKGSLFLRPDIDRHNVVINDRKILFRKLSIMIYDFYNFVLEINKNLPTKKENGIYYYGGKKKRAALEK